MGSVQNMMKCPQCGGIYLTDFDYHTAEETRTCFRCGKSEEWFILRDQNGNAVLSEDGKLQGDYKENTGFGSMKIAIKQGAGHLWTFSQPLDDDTVEYFKEAIQDENVDPDESYLMSWDAEKQE